VKRSRVQPPGTRDGPERTPSPRQASPRRARPCPDRRTGSREALAGAAAGNRAPGATIVPPTGATAPRGSDRFTSNARRKRATGANGHRAREKHRPRGARPRPERRTVSRETLAGAHAGNARRAQTRHRREKHLLDERGRAPTAAAFHVKRSRGPRWERGHGRRDDVPLGRGARPFHVKRSPAGRCRCRLALTAPPPRAPAHPRRWHDRFT
jgi:hypothetical protein